MFRGLGSFAKKENEYLIRNIDEKGVEFLDKSIQGECLARLGFVSKEATCRYLIAGGGDAMQTYFEIPIAKE